MERLCFRVCFQYVSFDCVEVHFEVDFRSIIRTVPESPLKEPEFKLVVKCGYILKACKDVIKSWPGVSWHADPLEVGLTVYVSLLELKSSAA